jgi:hypothetical protein
VFRELQVQESTRQIGLDEAARIDEANGCGEPAPEPENVEYVRMA